MLNETIFLFGFGMLLQAIAASLACWGFLVVTERRWVWLCLLGASLLWGLRSAIPFWVALNVGLYDFRDGLLAALSAVACLAAMIGLLWRRGAPRSVPKV